MTDDPRWVFCGNASRCPPCLDHAPIPAVGGRFVPDLVRASGQISPAESARSQWRPLWFVQRHASAWWYWRDLRIGLLIGTDNVKVSLLFLTVEFHR